MVPNLDVTLNEIRTLGLDHDRGGAGQLSLRQF